MFQARRENCRWSTVVFERVPVGDANNGEVPVLPLTFVVVCNCTVLFTMPRTTRHQCHTSGAPSIVLPTDHRQLFLQKKAFWEQLSIGSVLRGCEANNSEVPVLPHCHWCLLYSALHHANDEEDGKQVPRPLIVLPLDLQTGVWEKESILGTSANNGEVPVLPLTFVVVCNCTVLFTMPRTTRHQCHTSRHPLSSCLRTTDSCFCKRKHSGSSCQSGQSYPLNHLLLILVLQSV